MHGYEEPESIALTSLSNNQPLQARIVAVTDLALATNESDQKTHFQLVVKLAKHAANALGFELGWTTLFQMARSTQNFLLASNFITNSISGSGSSESLRKRALQELILHRRQIYADASERHECLSLNGNQYAKGTARDLIVKKEIIATNDAAYRYSEWRADVLQFEDLSYYSEESEE